MTTNPDPKATPIETSSPTARVSSDQLGLGRTSGQRGAEILAGFRAEKFPSPETIALSRWSGRIVARLLMQLASSEIPVNFTASRAKVIEGLIRRSIPKEAENITIVEIAAGMSPRGLLLAAALPNAKIIEVDLPGVIQDKQNRLKKAHTVVIPPNLQWLEADLGVQPLTDVLKGQLVDVVAAEGLLPYFAHTEIVQMISRIKDSLKVGGHFVADVPWQEGMDAIKQVMGFFSRQAGTLKGIVQTEAQARQLLQDAGYANIEIFRATQFVNEFELPEPLADFSLFLYGEKGTPQHDANPGSAG